MTKEYIHTHCDEGIYTTDKAVTYRGIYSNLKNPYNYTHNVMKVHNAIKLKTSQKCDSIF